MTERSLIFFTILMSLITFGCATQNPEAPPPNQAHPALYLLDHALEANADLAGCQTCHGTDFQGTGNPVPSCFSCHENGPPFAVHSLPYTDPADHGPAAKADQALCRGCHGDPPNNFDGGIVADPELFDKANGTCSTQTCHPFAKAHPTNWQGTNEDIDLSYDSTHRTVSEKTVKNSCSLCHNTTSPGAGAMPAAPSCFSASFTNSDDITSGCHSDGFDEVPHDIPYTAASSHGSAAKADLAACQACHGVPGTIQFNGGLASTGCSTADCHPNAGAHPTRWQGTNDNTPSYLSNHRNAGNQSTTCTICHDFTQGRTAPNPAAPSCFSADFKNGDGIITGCHAAGPSVPHAIPFTDAALHGPEAKADLTYCQQCHADPFNGGPGSNPRFNVRLGILTSGCEDCHAVNTAHPVPLWTGAATQSHKTAGKLDTACALCHGAALNGGVGPACSQCHAAGDPLVDINCASCHSDPPDGNSRPNRDGSHTVHDALANVTGQCSICHNGSGTNSEQHYDESGPANVTLPVTYRAKTGTLAYDTANNSCSGVSCHGGQATPDWETDSINVDTDCLRCHESGNDQYNSPNSGDHGLHLREGFDCTDCHNVDDPIDAPNGMGSIEPLLVKHFAGLDTSNDRNFEGDPAKTIRNFMNYNTGGSNPTCTFNSLARCHNTDEHKDGKTW